MPIHKIERISKKGYSVWTKTGGFYKFWTFLENFKTKKQAQQYIKRKKRLATFRMLNQPLKIKKGNWISYPIN